MNSRWSDNLRERMEAHEEPSPEGLWENIEQIVTKELPFRTRKHPFQSPSGRKKALLWAKRIGVAAAILSILLFVGDLFLNEDTRHSPAISQRPEVGHTPGSNLSIDHDNEEILVPEEGHRESLAPDNHTITFTALASTASADRKTDDFFNGKEEDEPDSGDQSEHPGEGSGIEEKVTDRHSVLRGQHHDYHTPEPNIDYPTITREHKPTRWQASLHASNTSSGSSNTYNGYRSFLAEEVSMGKDDGMSLLVKYPHEGIVDANKQSTVYTEVRHRQPVTMGASIKYNLNEKWSLTSGLTYTILSSQLRSGSHSHYYTGEQTLHNIGIPLGINYNLWKVRNVSVYVAGGGMVEKNVSGTLSTGYVMNGKAESAEKENVSVDRLQWSVNTSVGVEYNLFSKIGLYAEPGVIYYFKNGNEVETIYKEKPVNVHLRIGIRFSLGK
ncbi:outer membrane beta-barrel protein [Proteiniphilum sp. X52]|uniref:outer membrane beta-barrel protein n=1 Tax=Proteiniphilum sp. X52 TaxID=2382159 RepID=UPI000F0A63AE|nr:outer membrane beta-barrel protein [Proteiniphilum sp. X52]RNC65743.1 PorT family protein [Proteiniphilum sp. X52]